MSTVSRSKQPPADRSVQTKKTAVPGALSKGMSPAARSTPGARPPANTVNERTQKRNHDDAFPPKSSLDLGQQPLRYSRDRSNDADKPEQAKSRWAVEKFEVIDLSSDSDEDADSDDEPLARGRKRRMTSGTPNPSASQQKKPTPVNPASRPSSSAPKDRQSGKGLKRLGDKSTYQDFLSRPSFQMPISSGPPKVRDPAQDPGRVRTAAEGGPTENRACAATPLENEKQELEAKLKKLAADNQALSQQLRESRAISKKAIHDQLSKEREVTMLRSQLVARDQQDLTSERASLSENITQLRDELAQEKEDGNQSAIAKQNEITKLQKLLDDQALQCMKLESAVADLQRKQEPGKDSETAAKITRLEASNRELREEVEWYEGNRDRMRKEWDERVAMEMRWKDNLQALVNNNNNNMSLAERRRAALAAPDPIQQAAQRDSVQREASRAPIE